MSMVDFTFQKDTFKLIQLTDIHLVKIDGGGPEQQTLDMIERMTAAEKPDLYVVTGDLSFSKENEQNFAYFCDFMDRLGTPWAFAFGNHDRSHGASVTAMEELMRKSATCVYCHGDEGVAGDGNYCVRLFDGEKLPWGLYMLDSHEDILLDGKSYYAHIEHSQIQWYRRTRDRLRAEFGAASSLLFFHIPLHEHLDVWEEKRCFGEKNEAVCYSYLNSGLFCALQEDVSAKGVFVGHDHTNDYIGELYGVRLAYGRGTGFGGGGRGGYGKDGFLHGGRVIVLNRNQETPFETYLWLEDGSVVTQQPPHDPEGRDDHA